MIERIGTNSLVYHGEIFNFLPWIKDPTNPGQTVAMVIDPRESSPGKCNVEYAIVTDKEARRMAITPKRAEALVDRKLEGAARALLARRTQLLVVAG